MFFWGELWFNETLGSPRWQWFFFAKAKTLQKLSDVVNAEMQQWWANVYEEQDVYFFPIIGACPKLCIFNLNEENHCKQRFFLGTQCSDKPRCQRRGQMVDSMLDPSWCLQMESRVKWPSMPQTKPAPGLPGFGTQNIPERSTASNFTPRTSPMVLWIPIIFKKTELLQTSSPPKPGKTCFLCGKPTTCFFEYQIYHVFFRGTYLEDHPT